MGETPVGFHGELVELFTRLRGERGNLSLRTIAQRANVAHSYVSGILNGSRLPSAQIAAAVAGALGATDAERKRASEYAEKAVADRQRDRGSSPVAAGPPPGWPLAELSEQTALDLDVHPSIEAADSVAPGLLPAYVARPHDDRLAEIVADAERRSTLVVLIGDSATGKSRAGWEAVQRLPAGWRLWHPIRPTPVDALLEGIGRVRPRTVVWLDEIHRYLGSEHAAAELREALRTPAAGPLLVLGTTWLRHWDDLVREPPYGAPDPHAVARSLLDGHELVVPTQFSDDDLAALLDAAGGDGRLRMAVDAGTAKVTQFLAGTPELLRRYARAPAEARVVVWAAMDAHRLGVNGHLPEPFLREAALGYVDEDEWPQIGSESWFEAAVEYLGRRAFGTPGPLTRVLPRPGTPSLAHAMFRLAEQLAELGATERRHEVVPAALWDAALHHLDDPAALATLARAALARWYDRIGASLAERAAERGNAEAAKLLAGLARRRGNPATELAWLRRAADSLTDAGLAWQLARKTTGDEARRWWRRTLEIGGADTIHKLRSDLSDCGLLLDAIDWLAPAAAAGDPKAIIATAWLLAEAGRPADADVWFARAAGTGDWYAGIWANRLADAGRHEDAIAVVQPYADGGEGSAMVTIAEMHLALGRTEEADRWLERAVRQGGKGYLKQVVPLLTAAGRRDEAIRLVLVHAERGDFRAVARASQWLANLGAPRLAREVWAPLVDASDGLAMRCQAERYEADGEDAEAERLYRAAADTGDPAAIRIMSERYVARGEHAAALAMWRSAMAGNRPGAAAGLADFLIDVGKEDEARAVARRSAEHGDIPSMLLLGTRLLAAEPAEAEQWLRRARGSSGAAQALSDFLEASGRLEEAVKVWEGAALGGNYRALRRMIRLLRQAGHRERADRAAATAIESGQFEYHERTYLAAELGLVDAALMVHWGIEPGGATAIPWAIPEPTDEVHSLLA